MTKRPGSALAVIAIFVALAGVQLSASAPPVAAEGPNTRLQGHVPATGGLGLLLWTGGSTSALLGEAERKGCSVLGIHVNRPGGRSGLVTYIPDTQIAAANQPFFDAFPTGHLESMPVILTCRPHIQGVVLDTEGEPFSGASVTAWRAYPFGHRQYTTESETDGSFDIVVDPGTYTLLISTPGARQSGWYVPGGLTTNRNHADELNMRSSGVTDLVIGLQPTFAISGVVLSSDGTPFSGIGVMAERQPVVPITGRYVTGADGQFVVHVAGDEPTAVGLWRRRTGGYTWYNAGWYGPGGYTAQRSEIRRILPGTPEAIGIEIVLPPLKTISGVVRGPEGPPPSRILVRAYVGGTYFLDITQPNGEFSVTLPEGEIRLALEAITESTEDPRYVAIGWYASGGLTTASSQLAEIDLRSGDVDGLVLEITELRQISGHVRQPDTDSPRTINLALFAHVDGNEDYLSSLLVGDDGKFSLPVMDGRYSLAVRVFDGGRFSRVATHDVVEGITYGCEQLVPFEIEGDATDVEIVLPGIECTDTDGP